MRSEFVRYTAIAVVGLAVDLLVALTVARVAGAPLLLAAVSGFVTALLFNYVMLEFWAFRGNRSGFSASRLLQTAASAGVALAIRGAMVWLLDGRFGDSAAADALVLISAAGASFVVNFLLVRLVFARR